VVAGGLLARNNATLFSDIIKDIGTRNGGFAYLLNSAGVVIAHRDTELVMNSFSALKAAETDPRYGTEAEAVRSIVSQKQGSMDHDIEGRKMVIGFSPVPGFDMILVAMVEERVVLQELNTMRNLMFIDTYDDSRRYELRRPSYCVPFPSSLDAGIMVLSLVSFSYLP
jgi:methyl-accepting chemotaxis protein